MELRSGLFHQTRQTMAITPQVIQSIKLLKFGQEELVAFLREQEERNPLIEVIAGSPVGGVAAKENVAERALPTRDAPLRTSAVGSSAKGAVEMRTLEETCPSQLSLREHLLTQVDLVVRDPVDRRIAVEIVESIEPDGYLRRTLSEIADHLGLDEERLLPVLRDVQSFEPAGVGARSLAECIRLQLADAGLMTPAMTVLLDNLALLAGCEFDRLARLCQVDKVTLSEMVRAIRSQDPRPGLQFDGAPILPALPDLKLDMRPDGTFHLELNTELLPRILVNRDYFAEMNCGSGGEGVRFVADCMKNANWLTRNLDQRAKTILKVATEIVKRQTDFFLHGVSHIKPLSQSEVAEAVGMHPSTICRATANKFILTGRGLFELNFFFSNAIAGAEGDESFSAESIRARIRGMIAAEPVKRVLSDEAITEILRKDGVDIARRTVAKYREMMNIPTSQLRKRQKRAEELENSYCAA